MSYNILLVDDDKDFREEFCDYLDEYHVIGVSNGIKALNVLRKPHEIDLVILDVMMPALSGTKILKKIKGAYPKLPVIILTGYSTKDVAVEALRGKADDYLEKPLQINKAREIIERLFKDKFAIKETDLNSRNSMMEKIKYFLERNYNKNVSLQSAAKIVSLTPKYLSRIFKESTGKKFVEYKLEVRMRKGKELLIKTKQTIEQISDKLGYGNTESFIRIFKKLTKITPTQYRQKRLKHERKKESI